MKDSEVKVYTGICERLIKLRKKSIFAECTNNNLVTLLSEICGYKKSPKTIAAHFNKNSTKANPDIFAIIAYAKLFGVSTDYILTGKKNFDDCAKNSKHKRR